MIDWQADALSITNCFYEEMLKQSHRLLEYHPGVQYIPVSERMVLFIPKGLAWRTDAIYDKDNFVFAFVIDVNLDSPKIFTEEDARTFGRTVKNETGIECWVAISLMPEFAVTATRFSVWWFTEPDLFDDILEYINGN